MDRRREALVLALTHVNDEQADKIKQLEAYVPYFTVYSDHDFTVVNFIRGVESVVSIIRKDDAVKLVAITEQRYNIPGSGGEVFDGIIKYFHLSMYTYSICFRFGYTKIVMRVPDCYPAIITFSPPNNHPSLTAIVDKRETFKLMKELYDRVRFMFEIETANRFFPIGKLKHFTYASPPSCSRF
jgi:hypothetical protein